jgi:hypothetical protein
MIQSKQTYTQKNHRKIIFIVSDNSDHVMLKKIITTYLCEILLFAYDKKVTRDQEILALPENLSSSPVFSGVGFTQICFCVVFYRSLSVL